MDTHPIHFHLFDVQVLNRVTWDNIIIPPNKTELGWKDTVRMSPLEDTIVALRPIIPRCPFEVPNAVRPLNPMMPLGCDDGLQQHRSRRATRRRRSPTSYVNFGWEYVCHCHILSHEEMDMMRPDGRRPAAAEGGPAHVGHHRRRGNNRRFTITWNDNSITETAFVVQRSTTAPPGRTSGPVPSPLDPR